MLKIEANHIWINVARKASEAIAALQQATSPHHSVVITAKQSLESALMVLESKIDEPIYETPSDDAQYLRAIESTFLYQFESAFLALIMDRDAIAVGGGCATKNELWTIFLEMQGLREIMDSQTEGTEQLKQAYEAVASQKEERIQFTHIDRSSCKIDC